MRTHILWSVTCFQNRAYIAMYNHTPHCPVFSILCHMKLATLRAAAYYTQLPTYFEM